MGEVQANPQLIVLVINILRERKELSKFTLLGGVLSFKVIIHEQMFELPGWSKLYRYAVKFICEDYPISAPCKLEAYELMRLIDSGGGSGMGALLGIPGASHMLSECSAT